MPKNTRIEIGGEVIEPGERVMLELPVAQLYTHEQVNMPVHVVHGRRAGPKLFVSAAVHGDELNGIEIIRQLLTLPALSKMHGTLYAVPIVNVLGVTHQSRYLPDRRDLNRCFPGSERGSLGGRLADLFMREIVSHATHGLDLHTGAVHRSNLPQIRANLDDPETASLARAFGAPVVLDSALRDGSLRAAACDRGIPVLVYEAGEALRFDSVGIRVGLKGVANVMRYLGMLPRSRAKTRDPFIARASSWVRTPTSGVFRAIRPLGAQVDKGETLGVISNPFGDDEEDVPAPFAGVVIGRTNIPLVHEGEAVYHIARFARLGAAAARVEEALARDEEDDHRLEPVG